MFHLKIQSKFHLLHFIKEMSSEAQQAMKDTLGKIIGFIKFKECLTSYAQAKKIDKENTRKDSKYYWVVEDTIQCPVHIPHTGNVGVHKVNEEDTKELLRDIFAAYL